MRYRFTSIRMTSVRKMREEQVLAGMRRNWRPDAWLLGMQNGAAAVDSYRVTMWSSNSILGVSPEELKTDSSRFLYTSVHSGQKVETTQVSTSRWMDKQNVVDSYLAIKRAEILISAATWMSPEDIVLSTVSQTQKDQCSVIPRTWATQNGQIQRDCRIEVTRD